MSTTIMYQAVIYPVMWSTLEGKVHTGCCVIVHSVCIRFICYSCVNLGASKLKIIGCHKQGFNRCYTEFRYFSAAPVFVK